MEVATANLEKRQSSHMFSALARRGCLGQKTGKDFQCDPKGTFFVLCTLGPAWFSNCPFSSEQNEAIELDTTVLRLSWNVVYESSGCARDTKIDANRNPEKRNASSCKASHGLLGCKGTHAAVPRRIQ